MKKILEYYDKVNSVCSFWRGRGVLSELERIGECQLTLSNWEEDWSEIRRHDIAFFQRPMSSFCLQQVFMCKDLGLKVWLDFDDFMYIPENHPMYHEYTEMFNASSFRKMLLASDVITVTNNEMAMSYVLFENSIKNKIRIIPNAINDHIFKFKDISQNKYIIWRGGDHRYDDIKPYVSEIDNVLNKHKDWTLFSLGNTRLNLKSENYRHLGSFSIHNYFALILGLNPAIFIDPLELNKFNKCKSNILWQEATLCGAVTISPSWADFQCGFRYGNFIDSLEEAIVRDDLRVKYFEESVLAMQGYLLSNVNEIRKSIINE